MEETRGWTIHLLSVSIWPVLCLGQCRSVLPRPLGLSVQIVEENKPPSAAQPPVSAVPGGFLKQLVRETEKENRQKEPEIKEERVVREGNQGLGVSLCAESVVCLDVCECECFCVCVCVCVCVCGPLH